jgi:putative oxidoreductase
MRSVGLLILRLGIGGYMVGHGAGKLRMLFAGTYEGMGAAVGLDDELTLGLLVFAEFFCALLVVIGLGTRFAAVPIVIAMAVAALVAHASDPWIADEAARQFFAREVDFPASRQPALMFMTVFMALIFTGAGRFSIAALIRSQRVAGNGAATSHERS